jgi:hypothetical protein
MTTSVTCHLGFGYFVSADVPSIRELVPMLRERVRAGTTPVGLHLGVRFIQSHDIEAALMDHNTDEGVLQALEVTGLA